MFGSRLKTWMENYIGRPRKKETQKEKPKGNDGGIVESSESLACSDTGVSFSSQQVLSSSATDNREGYSTATMESEKSGMTHCHTAVSLPSPESAYSTGYSTDGASPGETGPPEYYINIRTGKHYFPSPAPTPTSPQPNTTFLHLQPDHQSLSSTFFPKASLPPSNPVLLPPRGGDPTFSESFSSKSRSSTFTRAPPGFPPHPDPSSGEPRNSSRVRSALSISAPNHSDILNFSKSPCKKSTPISQLAPIRLFLKSPRHERGKPRADPDKTPPTSAAVKKLNAGGKPKKWFRQPFQKFGHRRTDSCDEGAERHEPKKETHLEKNFRYLLGQENSASPRQRNRIKTNPWLPTEPMSSQNFHNLGIGFSPSLARNRSCSNTPLQNRKVGQIDAPQDRMMQFNGRNEETRDYLNAFETAANRQPILKLPVELSDHSEEDLTLNEVMGTYNESYVYEKETDILSDSDPTDCEDYGTDSEAENGGDERDSHDDELDFIDNGSLYECEDSFPQNTGRCTYHDVYPKKNSILRKGDRRKFRKDPESRKILRRDQDSKVRRDKRRQTRKTLKREEEAEEEDRKKPFEEKIAKKADGNSGSNLSRVLARRMLARNTSKSAEGTPVTARRQENLSEPRETLFGGNERGNLKQKKTGIMGDGILIDLEADNKYNELMKEAENIFESMRNSPVIKNRKEIINLTRLEETPDEAHRRAGWVDPARKGTTQHCSSRGSRELVIPARKSPKELGLKLSVETPKKPKRLDFEASERRSFKTRPSAHSPLDPLGPSLRNFAVFSPAPRADRKVSTSSSEDSEPRNASGKRECAGQPGGVQASPVVPIAFQSVDLGNALSSYCPQSEPVKRKIYSCSKTYDKLVKRFENKPTVFVEAKNGKVGSALPGTKDRDSAVRRDLETCLDGNQGFFPSERRRDGEENQRGGILRRPPLVSGRSCCTEKIQGQSFDSDVFR